MSDETAFKKPATLGQLKEIIATLVQSMPSQLSCDDAQHIIEDKGWLIHEIQKLFTWRRMQEYVDLDTHFVNARADMMVTDYPRGTVFQIAEWAQFYRELFDLDIYSSTIKIPLRRPGFYRLIVVAQGLTLRRIMEVARKDFPIDSNDTGRYYTHNEGTRGMHERLPTQTYEQRLENFRRKICFQGSAMTEQSVSWVGYSASNFAGSAYAVWVRDSVDPDAEYTNVRPPVLERRGVKCSTLLEHLLFHLKYFRETGQFLDRNERYTMCSGSRDAHGSVVAVFINKSRRNEKCRGLGISIGLGTGSYSSREVST